MGKLKLQIQMSIDGFIARDGGEMDWMVWDWDEDLKSFTNQLTRSVGTIILGKSFAEGFIPYWQEVVEKPEHDEYDFARLVVEWQKVVFSRSPVDFTTASKGWINARRVNGKLEDEVNRLKQENEKDIIAYGGSEFVSSLIRANLVDEFHLYVNPTAIGQGKQIFHRLESAMELELKNAVKYDCGIVVISYVKK